MDNWQEIFDLDMKGRKLGKEFIEEGKKMRELLIQVYPQRLDGRQCILELKNNGSNNWRQMEWIGWYFEEKSQILLFDKIGGGRGPKFGNVEFDYKLNFVWDFKAHAIKNEKNQWTILNDVEAIVNIIEKFGSIGYCICEGIAEYDDEESTFKKWHDELKGKTSDYVKERIKRGAPSRRRKVALEIQKFLLFGFMSLNDIKRGVKEKWIKEFQKDFRNADGSPRREKLQIDLNRIPEEYIIPD